MDNFQNIVVVIDADNTQCSKLPDVLREISTYGRIAVKRAYGNWKKGTLSGWEDVIKRNAIHAMQQYDYVVGKNATDMALVIDTMDLLYKGIYDAFAIVSSDSDFTPLAIRLREAGHYVMGIGKDATADSFKKSCDDFIVLENLSNELLEPEEPMEERTAAAGEDKADLPGAIHQLLRDAYDTYKDANGYVNVGAVGSYIKRIKPDFDSRTYGYKKLSELISDFPERYKVHMTGHGCTYQCLNVTRKDDIRTVHRLLKKAYLLYKDDSGYAHIGPTGSYLKNMLPDFKCGQHGYKNITDLITQNPQLYRIRKKGSTVRYCCLK